MKREPDYENMSVYEQVLEGLKQSLGHARGELTLKTTVLPAPAPKLSRKRVIAIRKKAGMSQGVMAAFLNVPKRTLESWEQGRRSPKAGEARLLQICESAPKEFEALVVSLGGDAERTAKKQKRTAA